MAMRKSFIEIGYKVNKAGLTEAKTAVDKLIRSQEKMLNNLDAYDQRNRKIAASQQSVNSELQRTATYQSQAAKEQAKVTESVVKTRAEQRKLAEAEGKTRQKAVDTGDSIVRSNEKSTRAVNRTRRSTEQTSASFDKLHGAGSRLVNMGSAISMAMLPVAAAFKKSAEEATELENKYTTIKNLLHTGGESAGASAAETKQMEKDNNQFALQYGVSPVDMSKGGEELIRRGYSGNQELASHKYFLQAARASGDDYNSVVGYGAPALEQFGYKTKAGDSQKKMAAYTKTVLNQMAYGADLSATDFTGIGNALRYAGATAHSGNQSLSGTISAIGVLSNNGQDGTVAGTGLRKDINSLMNPSSGPRGQGEAALKSIGLTPDDLRDSHDNLLSLDKAFELLNSHMKGMNDTERASVFHGLFGTTGQESALILSKNVEQMKSLTGQVQNAEKQGKGKGYIADLAQKNMKSWKNQIEVFKQYLNVMGLGFTKTVLPGFTHMLTDTNHVLKALIKLPEPVKDLTGHVVALGSAMGVAYAGSKLLRKGLDWMGGSASTKVGRQTQMVEDVAQTSEGAVPTVTSTRPSVRATTGLRGKWNGLSGMSKLAIAGVGLDVGTQAVGAFKEGIGSKAGGKDLWSAAGKTTGATIGGVLTSGNPVGIMIGEQVGDTFAKYAVPAIRRASKKSQVNSSKYNERANKNGSQSLATLRTNPYGSNFAGMTSVPKKVKSPIDGLSKQTKHELNATSKLFSQAQLNWSTHASMMNSKGRAIGTSVNKSLYGRLSKSAAGYTKAQQKSSNSAIKTLQKYGAVSATEAQKIEKTDSSSLNSRLHKAKSAIAELGKVESKGGKGREKAVQNAENRISALMSSGSSKQKIILGKLRDSTKKISATQASNQISASYKAMRKQITAAQSTYLSVKKSADKKYKAVESAADHEYYVSKSISKKQHDEIVAKAESTRDKSIAAAKKTETKSVSSATRMHKQVVVQVEKMSGSALKSFNSWTGQAKTGMQKFGNWLEDFWGRIKKSFTSKPSGSGKSSSKGSPTINAGGTISVPGYSGYAVGGPIRATQMAMVNEAGTEVAYNPRTGKFRLLGDGPSITQVRAGEHIINARDTRKLFAGGLGEGKTLKGYASGTTSLKGSIVGGSVKAKGFGNPLGSAEKSTKASMGKISKTVTGGYDKATKKSSKFIKKFGSQSTRDWKGIHGDTKRYTGRIQKETIGDYDQLQKGADKQLTQMKSAQLATMSKIHSGMNSETKAIESDFNSIMGKLPGDAKDAMKGSITSLNGGFTAIDSALSQFGGNKSVLKPIHYATGSNGPIGSDQLAVLNDANSGPRQELVARGQQLLKPVGDNVAVHLHKGDEVFNGDQVERAKPYLPHFKKGTGASDSKLKSLAKANAANPAKAFSSEFTANAKPTGSTLQKGVTNVANTGAKKVGVPWSGAMWGLIQDTIEGGTAAGGKWIHTPGLALTNGFGAARSFGSHDGNDFAGPLGSAILAMHGGKVVQIGRPGHGWPYSQLGDIIELDSDDGYHQIYQEFGGMNNIKVAVGDVVKTGQRIATLGHLNGAGSGAHVHVGLAHGSVWDHGGSSTKGWLDITKMRGGSDGSSKLKSSKKKINGALTKLVKSQLGSTAIKWIEKNLQDTVGGGQVGGSVSKGMIEKAAKAMHVNLSGSELSTIQAVIQHESGGSSTAVNNWDVNAKNGTPSKGILQFIDPTFKHYAVKGHGQILNAYDQLLAMFNDSNWRRDVHTGGWGPTGSRRFATGGRPNVGESVIVGEKGPELVNFDRPATIRSADATRQLANKAGAKSKPSIQNTFHIDLKIEVKNGDAKEIAKNVKSALRDELDNLFSTELENLDY